MDVSAHRAYSLLKELAYERLSGSADERRAAERLLEEVKAAGVEGCIEDFKVVNGDVKHAKLVVTEPYVKEYECTGYECAESTPAGGLDGEFYYAENLTPVHLENCKGKIVMINGMLRRKQYEQLKKVGVAAIISFSGDMLDRKSESDCNIAKLRPMLTDDFGRAVALNVRVADAAEIVRRGATKMHIELESECVDAMSCNVCAVIEGTEKPDEIVSFGAHFDSVHFSTGVYDNMSGSVIIMEIMKYFAKNKPARTLKFNWYGSDALAGFACSRSPNEDVYMVQKMVRTCFGTNNVDNCARVCHSASVAGLAMTLGSGAMTNPIEDITKKPEVIMLVGSNPEEAHPVVGMQIRQAVQRGCKLIVVDPREIDLAKRADIHLKLKPGTNVAFANGMMHVIIEEGLQDEKFIAERTEGYEKIKEIVKEYTPEKVAEICHIDADDLRAAARMYAKADMAPIIYCLGVTEHSTGTEGVMSMSNMALLVGKLGREGCGVNPLRGQNNVQGACDMGALPGDFPGYQKLATPGVVEKFEKAWGVPLSRTPGTHATDVFPKAITGEIKGLYIYGEDPVVTDADTTHIIKALKSLDFFVIQELFMTETAQLADVILPGVSYLEKEGTFTNTERRVQRVRKAITLPGEARLDTDIIIDLMNRMGYPQKHMTSAEIMDEIASLTPSFGGISHARLDSEEVGGRGLQWPCPTKDHPGTYIMHVGKFTRGLGWFYPAEYVPSAELPCEDYPIILMTGRILYHYTTRAMTGKTPELMEIEGKSFIEMNIVDADKLGIQHGDRVKVSSRRGSIETTARVGTKTSPGETWMPFHFPDGNANWLTNAALDKYARIPEYKVCAVKVEKA